MRRIYFLSALILLSTSFFSCKKGNGTTFIPQSSTSLIAGKWVLQTEHSVQYINGVKQLDTVYNASQNSYVNLQFKSNGTYVAAGMYYVPQQDNLNSGPAVTSFTSSGTYNFAGTTLSMVGPVTGFGSGGAFYGTTLTTVPVITPVSNSVRINELTATNLGLHTENVYTYTVNNTSQTYKLVNDLSYTR